MIFGWMGEELFDCETRWFDAVYGFFSSLFAGDVLTVYDKLEDGWWHGELNGVVGIFPATYVEEIKWSFEAFTKTWGSWFNLMVVNVFDFKPISCLGDILQWY